MNSAINNLDFWRKAWFHLTDNPLWSLSLKVSIVHPDVCSISWSVNFKLFDIFRLNFNVQIECGREVWEVEVLKHILFDVVLIHSTEIVETFDFFELFAHFWPELIGYPYNSKGGASFSRGLFQENALIGDAVIADISEHNDAIFTVYALILKYKLI